MGTEKLDPKLCYSKPQLREVKRPLLLSYMLQRWNIPMNKAAAPADYTGPITGMIQETDTLIDIIWKRYQEEGFAGAASLKKDAPKAVGAEEQPETAAAEPVEKIVVEIRDQAQPVVEEVVVTEEVKTEVRGEETPARALANEAVCAVFDRFDPIFKSVLEQLVIAAEEREAIYNYLKEVDGKISNLQIGLKGVLDGVYSMATSICGYDANLETTLKAAYDVLGPNRPAAPAPQEVVVEHVVEQVVEQPPQPPQAQDPPPQQTGKTRTTSYDQKKAYEIVLKDGKVLEVTQAKLLDSALISNALLIEIGQAVGLEVRNMPRTKSVHILWDQIIKKSQG
jgi:hypothetical protein